MVHMLLKINIQHSLIGKTWGGGYNFTNEKWILRVMVFYKSNGLKHKKVNLS